MLHAHGAGHDFTKDGFEDAFGEWAWVGAKDAIKDLGFAVWGVDGEALLAFDAADLDDVSGALIEDFDELCVENIDSVAMDGERVERGFGRGFGRGCGR